MQLPNLTTDELQSRSLALAWKAFSESLAGREFMDILREMEDSALHAIQNCTDYRESTDLVIRYQQRKGVVDQLRRHIQSHIELLREENIDEHDTSYAGSESDSSYA